MNKLIIANWKMQLTHNEAKTWLVDHARDVNTALIQSQNKLIICPSFTELATFQAYSLSHIAYGSQDCSAYELGAHSGEVSVLSLKELGCTYSLVGHSERRRYHGESDGIVAQKAGLLMKYGIEPLICVGESIQERDNGVTLQVLERQLLPMVALMKNHGYTKATIAYEPIWSIGTQQVPRAHEISDVFLWVRSFMAKNLGQVSVVLLYGGSINERTIVDLGLSMADGFLLGKAGVEYEVLKKIIHSC